MFTFRYRGWLIHENFTSGRVQVQNPNTYDVIPVKSVHAAKCLIARAARGAA